MITALDTNVIVALWNVDEVQNLAARNSMQVARERGDLVICGVVHAELLASPGRSESFVDDFCAETAIRVEWELEEKIWREAGKAFQAYAVRRRRQRGRQPRRILADFLIGAHASVNGYKLLTLDAGVYRAAFPKLMVQTI